VKKYIFFIILLILISTSVSAIKIQLGNFDNKVFFEPDLKKDLKFTLSEAQRPARVPISLEGPMAKYTTVIPSEVEMRPGEQKEIILSLALPSTLPEGIHNVAISAKEIPLEAQAGAILVIPGVGATIKIVNTKVDTACKIGVFNTVINNNQVTAVLNLVNNGIKNINNAYADYELYGPDGKKILSWQSEKFSVPGIDSRTIESSISLNNVEPENYRVKGTVYCADKKLLVNKEIVNHATDIKLIDFRAYKKADRLRMEFELENEFKVPITAYGMVWFYDENNKKVANHAMSPHTLQPMSKSIYGFSKHFKGLRVPAGTYTLKGELKFEGIIKSKNTVISLTEEELAIEPQEGGFNIDADAMPKKEKEQKVVLEQPSGITINGKTIIRIIAAGIIIAVLFLLLFKNIHKRE